MKRILIVAFLVVLAAAAGSLWWWGRQSLPILDGELRLPGLAAPVEILSDAHGVPHVYASGPEDAWFAAGALHARDRLWQMELYRRAGYGRLSEILGEETLPIDKRLVSLGLGAAAVAEWSAAPPAVRAALTRYTQGVNAQAAQLTGRRQPLEFQLLRFTPAPWTEVDSLIVGRLLAWRLAENHQAELVRAAIADRFGSGEAQRLGGAYPDDAPTIVGGAAPARTEPANDPALDPNPSPPASPPSQQSHLTATPLKWPSGLEWLEPGARRGNSNNWVLSGSRTLSSRPLLANDPHLQVEFPSVWYELHLVAAGLDVIGVTVPGTPFVVIGHNARIAWGMTNTGADVQDLYIERLDLSRRRYLYQGQWLPLDITRVEIPVRGQGLELFEVWRTRHGTVFAEVGADWQEPPSWLSTRAEGSGEKRAFALRWDIASGEMAGAFEGLNRAGDWPEFVAAVERFTAPSQNIVYADIEGNIGYAMSGVLPIRSSGDGTTPRDGANGESVWIGRVSPSTLPRVLNPPSGYITSSNNEVDRRWPGLITKDWAAPYRTTQLHQAFASDERTGVSNATLIQTSVATLAAEHVLSGVDSALAMGRRTAASTVALTTLERLRGWDRHVDNRPIAALYEAFEAALWRRTFFDEMGEALFNRFYEWAGAERPAGLHAIIREASSRWFDDIGTIERRETRDDIYLLAAVDAVEWLQREYGDEDDWNWAEMHAVRFDHPLAGAGLPFRWLFSRGPSPIGGDGTTVMRVSYHRLRPFAAWEIPSWRQILDVGSWDDSRVVLPTGQSGHPLSPHYFDQNTLWREGNYRAQPFTRAAVDRERAHRLLLVP